MVLTLLLPLLPLLPLATARTVTVVNSCKYTLWPAVFTQDAAQAPTHASGWEQGAGERVSFTVGDTWAAARIWARTGCTISTTDSGVVSCVTGDCGGLECAPGVTGSPPATLAEFTLLAAGGPDNYDISLVDGFNVPVGISTSKPCPAPSCAVDLNAECPAVLRVEGGCLSKCQVDARAGHPDNNPNCCSGTYGTPEMCPASGVEYYDYFKSRCKDAYAYAYDEGSQSALWTCSQDGGFADYTVTFCP